MASRPPAGLTTRAAGLGLAVCALVVSGALPLREYLSNRSHISSVEAAQAAQSQRVAARQRQLTQLQDPAYVRSQARLRLHFVLPGETAYVVLAPPTAAVPGAVKATPGSASRGPGRPWFSQVWGSVTAADAR